MRKLSRMELLNLLLAQTKRADELEQRLRYAEEKLNDKNIQIDEAGSIAQAALKINGVFEAAEAAAAQYLDNIKSLNLRQEEIFAKRDEESKAFAERMLKDAEEKCRAMETETEKKCSEILFSAEQESKNYLAETKKRLDEYVKQR